MRWGGMANPIQFTLEELQLFLLAWFRITGVMLVGPIFGSEALPISLKAIFSFIEAAMRPSRRRVRCLP